MKKFDDAEKIFFDCSLLCRNFIFWVPVIMSHIPTLGRYLYPLQNKVLGGIVFSGPHSVIPSADKGFAL